MYNLRLFLEVAKHRSFSHGAVEHGITQSAASQRIGHLEKRLGVTLIDRSVRPLALTDAGKVFAKGCQDLVQQYDQLEQRVCGVSSGVSSLGDANVLVDSIYSAGIDLLNHVKDSFQANHQSTKVTLEYKHPDQVYLAVRNRQCDIGILSYPQRWRDVQVIPLRDEPMAVITSPGHPLAKTQYVHATALSRYPMVAFEPSLPVARRIRRYLRQLAVAPKITSMFDNIDTIKTAVAVSDDIAILPKRTAQREAAARTLAVIDLQPKLVRPMGIITNNKSFAPAVRAFIDHLLQHAGPQSDPELTHEHTTVGVHA